METAVAVTASVVGFLMLQTVHGAVSTTDLTVKMRQFLDFVITGANVPFIVGYFKFVISLPVLGYVTVMILLIIAGSAAEGMGQYLRQTHFKY
jgi:hypothetical protein